MPNTAVKSVTIFKGGESKWRGGLSILALQPTCRFLFNGKLYYGKTSMLEVRVWLVLRGLCQTNSFKTSNPKGNTHSQPCT